MKKKFLSMILAVLMVALSLVSASAYSTTDTVRTRNEVDIQAVLENPEAYPGVEITVFEDTDAYIEALYANKDLTPESRQRLIEDAESTAMSRAVGQYYSEIKMTVPVTTSYSCYPYFYVLLNYTGSDRPDGIVKVNNADLIRDHNGMSKEFSGKLYYNLESSTRLYWDLNGDFHNNGTTTFSGGASIPVGENATITFSVSHSTSHYKYVRKSGTYVI